jgi:EmrB/QacA subfamily drug resistance transporter
VTRSQRAALVLLTGSQFILILDTAIVWVALPSIGRELRFAAEDLSWVANGYSLLFGGLLLIGGRLADRFGRRRLFVTGLALFSAASLLGMLAPAPPWLIAARCLQGLAAALVAPAAMSLMMVVFPDRTPAERTHRSRAFGVWGALAALGGAAGFFLGGVLTDLWGWPAVFAVNVPIGLLGVVLAPRLLPADRGGTWTQGFDVAGAFTVTAGLALAAYVLVEANQVGWTSPRTTVLGLLSIGLLALFWLIQRYRANPLVPLRVFRRPVVGAANAICALVNVSIVPTVFFLSLYTQQVLGFSPFGSGMAALPLAISISLSATFAGRVLERMTARVSAMVGLALFAVGLLWLSRISGGPYPVQVLGPELVLGAGFGLAYVAATVAGTIGTDKDEVGLVSGLLCTSQQMGGVLGLALLAAVAGAHADRTAGYRTALVCAALFAVAGAVCAWAIPNVHVCRPDPAEADTPSTGTSTVDVEAGLRPH